MFFKKKTASAAASPPSITAAAQMQPTVNGTGNIDQAHQIVNQPVIAPDHITRLTWSTVSTHLDLSKQQVVTDSVSDVTEALGQHFVWGRQTVRYQAAYTRLVLEGYIKAKLNKGLNLSQIEGKLYKLETTLKNKSATETYPPCLPDMIGRVRFDNGLAPSLVYV